ncbi:MAG: redoxin domain-containing protein [Actinobacteria bacterium]|nr:redoxin domain-containing protein [Actinomycetota bacterium]
MRMDKQRHRPVLVELWDMTRPESMRTIPYLQALHDRYSEAGLRVVGVHTASREETKDEAAVEAAVNRLGITYPVLADPDGEMWLFYGAQGYPSRYLFNGDFRLEDMQVGEGLYGDLELMIQGLLDLNQEPLDPFRPEDADDVALIVPTADREGPANGQYAAGSVWLSLIGEGTVAVNGQEFSVPGPCALEVISNSNHHEGELEIEASSGVTVLSTCFAPGLAPAGKTD